jgi:predicted TIM-barrel fold metal-dependent hydrolase
MAMTETVLGQRGIYAAEREASLPYRVYDADNHIYAPADARIRHLPQKYHDRLQQTTGRITPEVEGDDDVEHVASTIGTHTVPEGGHGGVDLRTMPGMEGGIPIPGAMLNRLNPMRDLDELTRVELIQRYNEMRPAFEKKGPRLTLMDLQGVEAAVVFTGGFNHEPAFKDGDLELGAAVTRAWNEYVLEDWGFSTDDRIFCPLMVPLADLDLAIKELEWGLEHGARIMNLPVEPTQRGISPFDPYYDPLWARVNETGMRVSVHLHGKARHEGMAGWGEDPQTPYPRYDAFQWTLWWSDRPIMEMTAAMIFHNLFGRFPNVRVLIAEYGAVWLPYLLRKLDHAMMLGRRATFGKLEARPSQIFREHCIVAPYPEENVARVAEVASWDSLVFGSDFPHSEGLPDPLQYVSQLGGIDDDAVKKLMRDNLRTFLAS